MARRQKIRYRSTTTYRASKAAKTVATAKVGSGNAQGIIVTSAMVTFFLAFMNSYIVPRKQPRIRLFIGIGILYIGLSVIAQFNEKLARAFAILVMVTALLSEGGGVLTWLAGRGSHDKLGIGGTGTPNLPPITRFTYKPPPPGAVANTWAPPRPIGKFFVPLPQGYRVPTIPQITKPK